MAPVGSVEAGMDVEEKAIERIRTGSWILRKEDDYGEEELQAHEG